MMLQSVFVFCLCLVVLQGTEAQTCTYVKALDGVSSSKLIRQPGVSAISADVPSSDGCFTECNAEAACTSFLTIDGSNECALYSGVVNTTKLYVSVATQAVFSHYVKVCGTPPSYTQCIFTKTQTKITIPIVATSSGTANFLLNADACENQCLLNAQAVDCTAYSALSTGGVTNCGLYNGIDPSSIVSYSGSSSPTNGHDLFEESCTMQQVVVPCTYSAWGAWTTCTATCGGGTQNRSRTLTSGSSSVCTQLIETNSSCNPAACPTPCLYNPWGAWSVWSATCGTGVTQTRTRTILQQPTNGGTACDASQLTETNTTDLTACPGNCVYSAYTTWTAWSGSCGTVTRTQTRTIIANATNGGIACDTSTLTNTETQTLTACPTDCQYSVYTVWSSWSITCGGSATRTKTRTITAQPTNNGLACDNSSLTVAETTTMPGCTLDCQYSVYGAWSAWSATCGSVTRTQTRTILAQAANGGVACNNTLLVNTETQTLSACPTGCVYSAFSGWGGCSTACGAGTQSRNRSIVQQPTNGGTPCNTSSLTETQACTGVVCPCVYGVWGSWSSCSVTCGSGTITRARSITTQPTNGGTACNNTLLTESAVCAGSSAYCCAAISTTNEVQPSLLYSGNVARLDNNANCAAACDSHAAFICRAYIWAGNGSHCYLYGNLTTKVNLLTGSPFSLTVCNGMATAATLSVCGWQATLAGAVETSVTPSISDFTFDISVCQSYCDFNIAFDGEKLNPKCDAFAFKPNTDYNVKNCIRYGGITNATAAFTTGGAYTVYQKVCT